MRRRLGLPLAAAQKSRGHGDRLLEYTAGPVICVAIQAPRTQSIVRVEHPDKFAQTVLPANDFRALVRTVDIQKHKIGAGSYGRNLSDQTPHEIIADFSCLSPIEAQSCVENCHETDYNQGRRLSDQPG